MEYIDVKQFKGKVSPDAKSVTFQIEEGVENTVCFGYQKQGTERNGSFYALIVRDV